MARFGGSFSLGGRRGCVGVREGKEEEEETLCSFASGAIEVYNLHDHGRVHSWTLPSSDRLTCPAVYHRPSGNYCVVRNSQELLCWPEGSERADESLQTLPSGPVHSLLAPSTLPLLVVVYREGRVGTIHVGGGEGGKGGGGDVVFVRRITRSNQPKLHYTALCSLEGQEWVAVVYSHAGHSYVCFCALGAEGVGQPVSAVLTGGGDEVLSACLCGSNLVVFWSDGSLTCYGLHPLPSPSPNPPTLTPVWHTPLTAPSSTTHTLSLTAVSDDYFALGRCGDGGDGRLTLWEATYATCQSTTETEHNYSEICCIGRFVLAVGSEGVHVSSVEGAMEGGLAVALGRAKGRRGGESVVVIPSWLAPDENCRTWLDKTNLREDIVKEYITGLTNRTMTPTLPRFMSTFLSRRVSRDVNYCSVVRRLLVEDKFWGRDALAQLLQEEVFPFSLCGELLEAAMTKKDWALILLTLSRADQVPEASLVHIIQETLSIPKKVESYGVMVKREQLLFKLLSLPKNDSLLQQPLSQMPFSLVLSLLAFLQQYVGMSAVLSHPSPNAPPIPYPVILEWVGLLLDVHFTQLALSPEGRELLKQLQKAVVTQVTFMTAVSPLCGLVELWKGTEKERKVFKQPNPNWRYSVARINLNV